MVKFFTIKEKARGLARQQKYDLALAEYRVAIAQAEAAGDTSALRNLYNATGDASLLKKDAAGAVEYFDKAADLYLEEGLYDNAIALCHKILRHVPTKADVYGKLGRIYAEKGLRNEAIQNWLEYAERREKAGDAPAVILGLREVVALGPEADAVRSRLAEVLLAEREPAEALAHLEQLRRRAEVAGEDARADDLAGRIARIASEHGMEPAATPPDVGGVPASGEETGGPPSLLPAEPEGGLGVERFGAPRPPSEDAGPQRVLPGLESGFGFGPAGPSLTPPGERAPESAAGPGDRGFTPPRDGSDAAPATAPPPAPSEAERTPPIETLPGFTPPEGAAAFDVEEPPFVAVEKRITRAESRLAESPHDAEERIYLAELYQESGALDLARSAMEQGASELFASGQHEKAYRAYRRLAALVPGETEVMQKLVEVAQATGGREDLLESHELLADRLMEAGEYRRASEIHRRILEIHPTHHRSQDQLLILDGLDARSPAPARAGLAPELAGAADYVDLGRLVAEGDVAPAADPRMVSRTRPTGDEEADLQAIIDAFRRGVELNIDEGDHQSHYDLGVAFRQMGLLDEAVREFQLAARGPEHRGRAFELMGLCFMEKGMVSVAANCFRRGIEGERDPHEALGLHYHLARSLEETGDPSGARSEYEKVLALDVRFMDAADRLRSLA